MQLKYRGIAYDVPSIPQTNASRKVEGRYHGLPIKIALPQIKESTDELLKLIVYRGVKLALR